MRNTVAGPEPVENLRALTGARFVAAIAVLLCHFGPLTHWPLWIGAHGREAVAFFFVLSGFVLTYNYADRLPVGDGDAYRSFLRARFARIYPVHLLVLLLATAMMFWIYRFDPATRPNVSAMAMAGSWLQNVLLVQSYFNSELSTGSWSAPAWSVSCEATFYLAFPVLLWQMRRLRSPTVIACVAAGSWAATVLTLAAIIAFVKLTGHRPAAGLEFLTYHAPYLRIGEFITGCLAGLWFVRRGRNPWSHRPSRESAAWGGLAVAMTIATLQSYGKIPLVCANGAIFTPAFTLAIVAVASGPTTLGRLLSGRALCHLGEASYSLYLIHWIPVVLLWRLCGTIGSGTAVLAIVGSVLASIGLFYAVEDPCRHLLRRRRPTVRTVPQPMLSAVAAD